MIETSAGFYGQSDIYWLDKFKTVVGAREDIYHFDVTSSRDENSGIDVAGIFTPKFAATLGPWEKTEFYLNAGSGFHSNDSRGTTIRVDPNDPTTAADQVNPLVRSKGAEVGARTAVVPGLKSTVSLWQLNLDSELLFVGDAGSTEASRPSRRYGVEFANFYKISDWITLDGDLSFSRARFKGNDAAGDQIPGSIQSVFAGGISLNSGSGLFTDLRLRYFGPRPLIEDNSVRSNSSTLVNGRVGYRFEQTGMLRNITIATGAFNIFNRKVSDIDYYYTSRLPGEPAAGLNDIHPHPAETATYRVALIMNY